MCACTRAYSLIFYFLVVFLCSVTLAISFSRTAVGLTRYLHFVNRRLDAKRDREPPTLLPPLPAAHALLQKRLRHAQTYDRGFGVLVVVNRRFQSLLTKQGVSFASFEYPVINRDYDIINFSFVIILLVCGSV